MDKEMLFGNEVGGIRGEGVWVGLLGLFVLCLVEIDLYFYYFGVVIGDFEGFYCLGDGIGCCD